MENNQQNQQRDENLWRIARKRVEFKKHLFTYLIINLFLWILWGFNVVRAGNLTFPWPAFVTLGWGIGVAFNYAGAYMSIGKSYTEREYEKLKNRQ
jgi:hypothetical protein